MNLFSSRFFVRLRRWLLPQLAILFGLPAGVFAQAVKKEPRELVPPPFDRYLSARVAEISGVDWQKEITPQTWPRVQATMRKQLQGMLGLDPWPERGALHAAILGTVQGEGYVVEKLHFQSLPGVYVTANLYRPSEVGERLPAILYLCGHANVMENGVSMGNKTDYQHHGIWFARHGYVCIILDTIQLGEIRGFHHGTYNLKRWWWPARGYTPAGVEAWNGIRALDYLETRAEVDAARIGITGRSGGGAYSWWIGALDDRIRVAVPVAGITSLHNHVIDGAIEGHCDCMFMVNTERWDFDRIAALLAPRPLLISNTDKDEIFPLNGVVQVYDRARTLYKLLGKEANIGLHIAEGPHKDTQPLNVAAFEWMNRFLKGSERGTLIDEPARKVHPPRELKVFSELPSDEKVTTVDEFFVPAYSAAPPLSTLSEWVAQRDRWLQTLRDQSFRAWPANRSAPTLAKVSESNRDGIRTTLYTFESQSPFQLELQVRARQDLKAEALRSFVLRVLGEDDRLAEQASKAEGFSAEDRALLMRGETAIAYFHPRGVGPKGGWEALSERKQTQLRRRLQLVGESLEAGQTWDIVQAAAAVRGARGFAEKPLVLQASKQMAVNALYASLFIPKIETVELRELPASHSVAPAYLNVHRHLDLPQAVALAAERARIHLPGSDPGPWSYAVKMAELFEPGGARLQFGTGGAD